MLSLNAETSAGNMVQYVLTCCPAAISETDGLSGEYGVCVRVAAAPTCYLCPNTETPVESLAAALSKHHCCYWMKHKSVFGIYLL